MATREQLEEWERNRNRRMSEGTYVPPTEETNNAKTSQAQLDEWERRRNERIGNTSEPTNYLSNGTSANLGVQVGERTKHAEPNGDGYSFRDRLRSLGNTDLRHEISTYQDAKKRAEDFDAVGYTDEDLQRDNKTLRQSLLDNTIGRFKLGTQLAYEQDQGKRKELTDELTGMRSYKDTLADLGITNAKKMSALNDRKENASESLGDDEVLSIVEDMVLSRRNTTGYGVTGDDIEAEREYQANRQRLLDMKFTNEEINQMIAEVEQGGVKSDRVMDNDEANKVMMSETDELRQKPGGKVANWALTRGANLSTGYGYVEDVAKIIEADIKGEAPDLDFNSPAHAMGNWGEYMEQSAIEDIENNENRSDKANKALSLLYGASGSAADSFIGGATLGGTGYGMDMMLRAGETSLKDAYERTGDWNRALITGTAEGAVEGITEKFSADLLLDTMAKQGVAITKNTIFNLARQFAVEGSEEVASDLLDTAIDRFINGSDAEYDRGIQNYVENGYSYDEAVELQREAYKGQVMRDFLQGAVSGLMGGSVGVAGASVGTRITGNELMKDGRSIEEIASQASEYVQNGEKTGALKKALDAYGRKPSDYNAGKLLNELNDYEMNNGLGRFAKEDVKASEEADLFTDDLANTTEDKESVDKAVAEEVTAESEEERIEVQKTDIKKALGVIKYASTEDTMAKIVKEVEEDYGKDSYQLAEVQKAVEQRSEALSKAGHFSVEAYESAYDNALTKQEAYQAGKEGVRINQSQVSDSANAEYQRGRAEYLESKTKQMQVAAEESKTKVDGKEYGIKEFATLDTFTTKDGKTISVQEAIDGIEEENVKTAYSIASSMPTVESANAFVSAFKSGVPVTRLASTSKLFMDGANQGISFDSLTRDNPLAIDTVGEKTLRTFYDTGKDIKDSEKKEGTARTSVSKKGTGTVMDERTGKKPKKGYGSYLSSIAEITGLDIVVTDDIESKVNGYFDSSVSKIVLNSNVSDENLAKTLHHELTEFMDEYNPEDMDRFYTAITDWYTSLHGSNRVVSKINSMRKAYRNSGIKSEENKTQEEAMREVMNNAVNELLSTEDNMVHFVNSLDERYGVNEKNKIIKAMTDILRKIANAIRKLVVSNGENRDILKKAEELQEMWECALFRAIESYQGADVVEGVVETESGKRLSITSYEEDGREQLETWLRENYEGVTDEFVDDFMEEIDRIHDMTVDILNDDDADQYSNFGAWSKQQIMVVESVDEEGNAIYVPMVETIDNKGKPVVSCIVQNSEYKMNIDFSQVCKKRKTLDAILNKLVRETDFDAGAMIDKDIQSINDAIRSFNMEVACGLCFVDSRRYNLGRWASSFIDGKFGTKGKLKNRHVEPGFNDLVRSMCPEGVSADYFNFVGRKESQPEGRVLRDLSDDELNMTFVYSQFKDYIIETDEDGNPTKIGRNGNKNPNEVAKMAFALYTNPSLRRLVNPGDIISSAGLDSIRVNNNDLYNLLFPHGGQSKPKMAHLNVPYSNEIIRGDRFYKGGFKFDPQKAWKIGGVRVQSFSDYEANMFFDYVQMVADMAAKKLPSHAYTKEIDFVKLFGMTGIKINMSLVPMAITDEQAEILDSKSKSARTAMLAKLRQNAGLDENGDYLWQTGETFDYNDAIGILNDPRYSPNCGTIAVGVSAKHILKMLGDDNISQVIPYHKSGLPHIVAVMRHIQAFNDYTKFQTTKDAKGESLKEDKDFDFYGDLEKTQDPRTTANNYLKWCEENGYTPKFMLSQTEAKKQGVAADAIVSHPNYYKVLTDFAVYDRNKDNAYSPQKAVEMKYPEELRELVKESVKAHQELLDYRDEKLNGEDAELFNKVKEHFGVHTVEEGDDSVRYSISEDSTGVELTEEQKEFFKDSKVVDEEGKLLRMYHGTEKGGFTTFNPAYSDDKTSLFFTSSKGVAKTYSGTKEEFAPKKFDSVDDVNELLSKFDSVDIEETYVRERNGVYEFVYGDDVEEVSDTLDGIWEETSFYLGVGYGSTNYSVYLNAKKPLLVDAKNNNWDELEPIEGMQVNEDGFATTREYAKYAKENGYDGVIFDNMIDTAIFGNTSETHEVSKVVVVFEPNQVKSTENKSPTENEDIRYSISDDFDSTLFEGATQEIEEVLTRADSIIVDAYEMTGVEITPDMITDTSRKIAEKLVKKYKSTRDVDALAEELEYVFMYMNGKNTATMRDIARVMSEIALPIINESQDVDQERKAIADEWLDSISGMTIKLSDQQKKFINDNTEEGYGRLKNRFRGKIKFDDKLGTPIESVWNYQDVNGQSYGIAADSNGLLDVNQTYEEMGYELFNALANATKPQMINPYGMDNQSAAMDVALEIFGEYFNYIAQDSIRDKAQKMSRDEVGKLRKTVERLNNERAKFKQETEAKYKEEFEMAKEAIKRQSDIKIAELEKQKSQLMHERDSAGEESYEAYDETIARMQDRIDDLKRSRSRRDLKIAEMRASNARTKNRYRQTRLRNELKDRVKSIEKMIKGNPNTGNGIDMSLISPLIDLLNVINMDNGRSEMAKAHIDKMARYYDELRKSQKYVGEYDEYTADMIKDVSDMFAGRHYMQLNNSELQKVIDLAKQIQVQARNRNRLLRNAKTEDAREAARECINEIRATKGVTNAVEANVNKYIDFHLNPLRFFRKISGYKKNSMWMALYDALNEGQHKALSIQKHVSEMFSDVLDGAENRKAVKALRSTKQSDLVDIGLVDYKGKPVLVTKEMRLSLIMAQYNGDNMLHVLSGGYTVPDIKLYYKGKKADAYVMGTTCRYIPHDTYVDAMRETGTDYTARDLLDSEKGRVREFIKGLEEGLSDYEKRFLEHSKELFWNYTGQCINEVSEELKGRPVATVEHYFPIATDKALLNIPADTVVNDSTLEGMGILKSRVRSMKPIMLEGITDVITRQTDMVSKYAGLAIPIRDFTMITGQATMTDGVDGGEYSAMQRELAKKWKSKEVVNYINNLVADLQMGRSGNKSFVAQALDGLRGKFAGATLTANIGVAFKQAASYPTAASVLGYKPLLQAVRDIPKSTTFGERRGIKELEEINPLLWYRKHGGSTIEVGDFVNTELYDRMPEVLRKLTVDIIKNVDVSTVTTLEYASKYYVDNNFKDLDEGSKEYWEKVSEVFSRVVEETQPNYTTLQRPAMLRDPNSLVRALSMYKTQPLQNFGIVYDALGEYMTRVRENRASNNKETQENLKEANTNLARAISSQLIAASVFSAMTIASNLLYHKWWKYEPDDDRENDTMKKKMFREFMWGTASSIAGSVWFGDQLFNYIQYKLNGTKDYGLSISVIDSINGIRENIDNIQVNAQKMNSSITTSDKSKYQKKVVGAIEDLAQNIAEFTGIPYKNVRNGLSAVFLYAKDLATGDGIGTSEGWLKSNDQSQYEMMYVAMIDGDTQRYEKLKAELYEDAEVNGKTMTDDKISNGVLKQIAIALNENEITFDQADGYAEMIGKDHGDLFKKLEEVQNDGVYSRYDEAIGTQDLQAVYKEYVSEGVDPSTLRSRITAHYKDGYLNMYESKEPGYTEMRNQIINDFVASGLSRTEATKRVSSWETGSNKK